MAGYRVPKDDKVEEAIRKVMNAHAEIGSLKLFHELVQKELKEIDTKTAISPERLRRMAALMVGMKVHVDKGHSKKIPKQCYVCQGELKPVRTVDLYGKKTIIGKKCKDCGFRIEKDMSTPLRYRFYRR